MKDVNKMILLGRLGKDPVLRKTKSGTSLAQFSLATTRRYFREEASQGGEASSPSVLGSAAPIEETQWHRVVVWGKQGEACVQYLRMGSAVYVEGSLRSHKYQDKEGVTRSLFEVYAENVSFLGSRPAEEKEIEIAPDESEIPVPELVGL